MIRLFRKYDIVKVLLIFFFTTTVFAQNKFREGAELIVQGTSLKESFYKCIDKIGKPTVSETADKLILSYCFSTPVGKIIFGKDNNTKNIDAVIIFISSDVESDWLTNYLKSNSYFESGYLHIINNNLKYQNYIAGNQKVMFIAFGNIEFSGKINLTL